MRTHRHLELLADIVKLLKKHGAESFESLAECISAPETVQHITDILTQVARTSRTIPRTETKKRPKQEGSIPMSLVALKIAEPEKYRLLIKLHTDLVAGKALPSLRDIKKFALDGGLPEIRAKSRQKAISPLIGSLVKLPNDQLEARIESLEKYEMGDRSLEGWSNLILNRKSRLNEEQ